MYAKFFFCKRLLPGEFECKRIENFQDDEEHGISSASESIQALKNSEIVSYSKGREKSLKKLIYIDNAICDVIVKNRVQSKITNFFTV